MVVSAEHGAGARIGGGNLEATAVARARELLAGGARRARSCSTVALTDRAPHRARRAVLRRRGDAAARAAAGRCRRSRSSASATSGSSWPGSWPGTTSSCTSSTPAPSSSTRRGWRCSPTPWRGCTSTTRRVPGAGARRAARRHPRAGHDPRPRRGRRAVRRRAALRPPRLDRPDRVGGEVAPVPAAAGRRGARRRGAGPHHDPDRAARASPARSPATIAVGVAADAAHARSTGSARTAGVSRQRHGERRRGDLYRGTVLDTRESPVRRRRAARRGRRRARWCRGGVDRRPRPVRRGARPARRTTRSSTCAGGVLLPGLVDTHVHFPQVRVIGGARACRCCDWLEQCALPEEARLADVDYAGAVAAEFVDGLIAAGTTTALVFGSHFAARRGRPVRARRRRAGCGSPPGWSSATGCCATTLLTTPERAYAEGRGARRALARPGPAALRRHPAVLALGERRDARRLRGAAQGRRRRAASPRTSTRTSPRSPRSRELFPERDRLRRHLRPARAARAAQRAGAQRAPHRPASWRCWPRTGAAVAHCPTSNSALGSGLFPLRRHVEHGVRVALGSDVGAGTGFSLLKEGLQAYFMQHLLGADGLPLTAGRTCCTSPPRPAPRRSGLADEVGDLVGRQAVRRGLGAARGRQHPRRGAAPRRRRGGRAGQGVRARRRRRHRRGVGRRRPHQDALTTHPAVRGARAPARPGRPAGSGSPGTSRTRADSTKRRREASQWRRPRPARRPLAQGAELLVDEPLDELAASPSRRVEGARR